MTSNKDDWMEREEDLGSLVPIYYDDPVLSALCVAPKLVGFRRVDDYGNTILGKKPNFSETEEDFDETDEEYLPATKEKRKPFPKYISRLGIAAALAIGFYFASEDISKNNIRNNIADKKPAQMLNVKNQLEEISATPTEQILNDKIKRELYNLENELNNADK